MLRNNDGPARLGELGATAADANLGRFESIATPGYLGLASEISQLASADLLVQLVARSLYATSPLAQARLALLRDEHIRRSAVRP